MKSNKSWRTNIIALLGVIIIFTGIILVFLGKASFTEVLTAGGGLALVLSTINGYLSKDKQASHTYASRTLDPDKPKKPSGKS